MQKKKLENIEHLFQKKKGYIDVRFTRFAKIYTVNGINN